MSGRDGKVVPQYLGLGWFSGGATSSTSTHREVSEVGVKLGVT